MSISLFMVRMSLTINLDDYPSEFHSCDAFFTYEDAENFIKKSIEIDLYDFIKYNSPCNPDDMKSVNSNEFIHYLFEIVSKSSYNDKFDDDLVDEELDELIQKIYDDCVGDKELFYNNLLDKSKYNVDTYDIDGNLIESTIVLNNHSFKPWGRIDLLK